MMKRLDELGLVAHEPYRGVRLTDSGRRVALDSLEPGAEGRLVSISDSDPEMLRYLAERGIAPGDALSVVERQPFGGPLFVRFGEEQHAIGGALARAMRVATRR
jgi:DtxR family Mn-dependent transcriptional regulator